MDEELRVMLVIAACVGGYIGALWVIGWWIVQRRNKK